MNFALLSYTSCVCNVIPYNSDHHHCEKNVPIITGATSYTCQSTGQTYILVINKGLWFGPKLSHTLLNQNQIRFSGISVYDNPFDHNSPLCIEHPDITIPLHISGTNIYLDSHTPTQHELDTCPHIHLTSDVEWDPQNVHLASTQSVEAEVLDYGSDVEPGLAQISSVYSFQAMAETLHQLYDSQRQWSISATQTDVPGFKTFVSKD